MKQKVALSVETLTRQRVGIVGIPPKDRFAPIVFGAESLTPQPVKMFTGRGSAYFSAGQNGSTASRCRALIGSPTVERAKARRRSLRRAAPRWLGVRDGAGIKTTCIARRSSGCAGLSSKMESLASTAVALTRRAIGAASSGPFVLIVSRGPTMDKTRCAACDGVNVYVVTERYLDPDTLEEKRPDNQWVNTYCEDCQTPTDLIQPDGTEIRPSWL